MVGQSTDMYEFEISSRTENYLVTIGVRIDAVLTNFDALVVDKYFQSTFSIDKPIYWVHSTESNKNLTEVESICSFFQAQGLSRDSKVLAIGGGIIQDLVTLAASLYMRGIKWSYAPTTLTGMMDSCLGGKSSINVGTTKNLVGNIYPPSHIFIDENFVNTLDGQSLTSGLSEGVKIAFAHGEKSFNEFIENPGSIDPRNSPQLQELIFLSLSSKKWFIEVDEFDKAERQLLNFGHSFGHAFEAACGFKIQHGLAVALGVITAINHPGAVITERSQRLSNYCELIVLPHLDLIEDAVSETDWELFKSSLKSDKKNHDDSLVLILPASDSPLTKVKLPYSEKSIEIAADVMTTTLAGLLNQGS